MVPSYGGARRLPNLLDALATQRFDGGWELIVVLDGVVDDSESVIEQRRGALAIRVVRLEENRGRAAALNAGFAVAEGTVLVRCDDDLEPGPTYVSDHVAAHDGPVEVGVVGLYRNDFGDTPYARRYGRAWDARFRDDAYRGGNLPTWRTWAGNCSVTRTVFDRVGDYDEGFRAYGWEDIDWGYRLSRTGVPIVLDPRLETVHHAAGGSTVERVRRSRASGRALMRFDAKHGLSTRPAAPRAVGASARLWSSAVQGAAVRATPERLDRLAEGIDRILLATPTPVARRLVAFAAQVAVEAGCHDVDVGVGFDEGRTL